MNKNKNNVTASTINKQFYELYESDISPIDKCLSMLGNQCRVRPISIKKIDNENEMLSIYDLLPNLTFHDNTFYENVLN